MTFTRVPVGSDAEDTSHAAQSEREEALWCQVVLLSERIKRLQRDNDLLRELVDLLKAKAPAAVAPIAQPEPKPAPKRRGPPPKYPMHETCATCGRPKPRTTSTICRPCAGRARWQITRQRNEAAEAYREAERQRLNPTEEP